MNDITALLPMKGHSERVPGKNIKLCAGKPLYQWVLESLVNTQSIKTIIVNTDSDKIANATKKYPKVVIHMRPVNLCGDMVSMNDIIKYDLSNSEGEHYIQTHVTNPLLKTATLETAITKYFENLATNDSIFSVTEMHSRLYDSNLKPINHDPNKLIRTQDLDPIYEENSNFFIFSKNGFNKLSARIGITPSIYPMDRHEALDIDTEQDFAVADAVLRVRNR